MQFKCCSQVRSLLAGEEAVSKGDKPREKNIKDYKSIVQTLRIVTSEVVTIRRLITSTVATPPAQMVPLNNAPYT